MVKVIRTTGRRCVFVRTAAGVAIIAITADIAGFAAAGLRCAFCYIRIRTAASLSAVRAAGVTAFFIFAVANFADAAVRRGTNLIIFAGTVTF